MASRIFVRNLPSSLVEDEFRAHFSRDDSLMVTDARLLKHRRIGYVGFKSHEDAETAVRYFNKSFLRMSRLSVELAKPVEDAYNQRHAPAREQGPPNPLKRKRDDGSSQTPKGHLARDNEDELKLKEFIDVMNATRKTSWKDVVNDIGSIPLHDSYNLAASEYQAMPKNEKRPRGARRLESNRQSTPEIVDGTQQIQELAKSASNATDDEWLRSRTSRLLDLEPEEGDDDSQGHEPGSSSASEEDPREPDAAQASDFEGFDDDQESKATTPLEPAPGVEEEILEKSKGRLFLRNLTYTIKEEELWQEFSRFGQLEEVHVAMDGSRGISKGFAFIQFANPEDAVRAYNELNGLSFQGRILHILPAGGKREDKLDDFAISQLPLKQQQKIRQKMEAKTATFKWNPLYMKMDDVMTSVSRRLGVDKSTLLNPTSSNSAVKQALAETHVIQEAKSYFAQNGVDLDSFRPGRPRGDTAILVKNFPHGTSADEIRELFEAHGKVLRVLAPPSGTLALIEMSTAPEGRAAFASIKYRKYKSSILFLEKAPKDVFSATVSHEPLQPVQKDTKLSIADLLRDEPEVEALETSTLFIRNLNFSTTSAVLRETFSPLAGFLSAKVKTKTNPKKPDTLLSMGFGFVEFRSKPEAEAALAAMNGFDLEGHHLDVRPSQKTLDLGEQRRNEEKAKAKAARQTKIVIKNLPFEATKKDVRALFGTYGQLRSVRVPKKFDSSARGFAFAEFTTPREAANAMEALRNTHLLGRRLNLDYATGDILDAEEEIESMQQKIGSQADKVALQKLIGGGRQRFSVIGKEPL